MSFAPLSIPFTHLFALILVRSYAKLSPYRARETKTERKNMERGGSRSLLLLMTEAQSFSIPSPPKKKTRRKEMMMSGFWYTKSGRECVVEHARAIRIILDGNERGRAAFYSSGNILVKEFSEEKCEKFLEIFEKCKSEEI